jgi:hypothetical protein
MSSPCLASKQTPGPEADPIRPVGSRWATYIQSRQVPRLEGVATEPLKALVAPWRVFILAKEEPMITLSASTLGAPGESLPQVLACLRQTGVPGLELRLSTGEIADPTLTRAQRHAVRAESEDAGIVVTGIASYVKVAASTEDDVVLGALVAALDFAADLGTATVRVFPGAPAERGPYDRIPQQRQASDGLMRADTRECDAIWREWRKPDQESGSFWIGLAAVGAVRVADIKTSPRERLSAGTFSSSLPKERRRAGVQVIGKDQHRGQDVDLDRQAGAHSLPAIPTEIARTPSTKSAGRSSQLSPGPRRISASSSASLSAVSSRELPPLLDLDCRGGNDHPVHLCFLEHPLESLG